jgi:hypothetical protein
MTIESKGILNILGTEYALCISGLADNSNGVDAWARNEEMVDWFAMQGPKIYKIWREVGAVE